MMTASTPSQVTSAPLVCDMTDAPDSPQERLAEYARLFDHALVGRERTVAGLTWRFRGRAGVEAWVRDLAAREAACCAFLTHTVSVIGAEVTWLVATNGDPAVEAILDEFYRLPETVADGLPGLLQRLRDAGLSLATSDDGNITSSALNSTDSELPAAG